MRPTRVSALVALVVVAGLVAYPVVRWTYGSLPPFPAYGPVTLLLLGIAEGYAGFAIRHRLYGRWRASRPIHPIAVARAAALAKASSLVGALAFGVYAGLLAFLATRLEAPVPAADARVSGFGLGAALVLVVGALYLERGCRVRPPKDEERPEDRVPDQPSAERHERLG